MKITEKILAFLRLIMKFLALPILMVTALAASGDNDPESTEVGREEMAINVNYLNAEDFRWDTLGLAWLLAQSAHDKCRYNDTNGTWLVYDGKVWRQDKNGARIGALASQMTMYLQHHYAELSDGLNEQAAEKLYNVFFRTLPTRKFRNDVISDARAFLLISSEDLNKSKNLFNCSNGTLNLETFELQPHNPDDLITHISNVIYDPSVTCPLFDKFLSDITMNDQELAEYIQTVLGYALSGETPLECMWIFCGFSTRNGKSTLLEAVRQVFGGTAGYIISTSPATFVEKKFQDSGKATGDIARIEGNRLMIVSEPSMRMILDTALIKTLTGRDMIVARALRESEREFYPEVKIVMNTNFLPIVNDISIFESYRIIVVPFYKHFSQEEIDPTVKTKLQEPEATSAILNWLVEGLKKARQGGLAHRPECIEFETERYHQSSDYLMQFFADRMKKCDKNSKAGDVYNAFLEWAEENDVQKLKKGDFFEDLRIRKFMAETGTVAGRTVKNVVLGYKVIKKRQPRSK